MIQETEDDFEERRLYQKTSNLEIMFQKKTEVQTEKTESKLGKLKLNLYLEMEYFSMLMKFRFFFFFIECTFYSYKTATSVFFN